MGPKNIEEKKWPPSGFVRNAAAQCYCYWGVSGWGRTEVTGVLGVLNEAEERQMGWIRGRAEAAY